MKKAVILFLSLLLATMALLAGCSGSSPAPSSPPDAGPNPGGKTKLTLWSFVPLHLEFYNEAVTRWNLANPNKQIELETASYPYEDYHNKLLISLQSGVGAPDIADIEINKFPNFLKGKPQLVDLTDVVAPERDKFVQSRFQIYSKDGRVYGMPTHVGATVMFYNKEMLSQAGVNADDIKTWDDFVTVGKKVVEKTGKPMTTVEGAGHWTFWPMISQRGSDIFDKDGNVTLDNQTNIETLQFIEDMVYKHKIAIPAAGGSHSKEEYYGFMNKGGAASVLMPFWYMLRFVNYMPDLKGKMIIRAMPEWPGGSKKSAGMGGTGTVIPLQTKQKQLAIDFLKFAKYTKEANIEIWKKLGFDPPRFDVWDSPEMKAANKFTDYFGTNIFDIIKPLKDDINPVNITVNSPKARTVLETKAIFDVIQQHKGTPAEALKSAADELRNTK